MEQEMAPTLLKPPGVPSIPAPTNDMKVLMKA